MPDTTLKKNAPKRIALIGNPSAGKSAMFSQMTGVNVIISNIPQTTVMVQQGLTRLHDHDIIVYDLPGVYSATSVTEDEAATKEFLLSTPLDAIIDIVDADLERQLGTHVVPTIATQGEGVHVALETAYDYAERERSHRLVSYDDHVERALV